MAKELLALHEPVEQYVTGFEEVDCIPDNGKSIWWTSGGKSDGWLGRTVDRKQLLSGPKILP